MLLCCPQGSNIVVLWMPEGAEWANLCHILHYGFIPSYRLDPQDFFCNALFFLPAVISINFIFFCYSRLPEKWMLDGETLLFSNVSCLVRGKGISSSEASKIDLTWHATWSSPLSHNVRCAQKTFTLEIKVHADNLCFKWLERADVIEPPLTKFEERSKIRLHSAAIWPRTLN